MPRDVHVAHALEGIFLPRLDVALKDEGMVVLPSSCLQIARQPKDGRPAPLSLYQPHSLAQALLAVMSTI